MKRTLFVSLVLLSAVAAACGDNKLALDAAPHPGDDAGDDAAIDAAPAVELAVVVAGDFTAGDPGVLSTVATATDTVAKNLAAGTVGDDPMLRTSGGELFIVNRADGNNVTIVDATSFALSEQLSTGSGSNPQDVAVVGLKLYVPVFGGSGVAELTRGETTIKNIDLSADDPDGKPNCTSAFAVGTAVYVSCELLNDTTFTPRGNGKIFVIDTTDDSVTSFDMQHENPFGVFEQLPGGDLVMATVNFNDSGSGCVERIGTTGTPASKGCVVDNTVMNGYAGRMAIDGTTMWLVVPASDFMHSALVPYDLTANTLGAALSPETEKIGDVAVCPSGKLAVSDTTMGAAGLRIYDATHELTTAALAVGLSPQSTHGLACY